MSGRMRTFTFGGLAAVGLALVIATQLPGQGSGSRGSADHTLSHGGGGSSLPAATLDRETAQELITVTGSAEIRVEPTAVRVILAITSEGDTAPDCMTANAQQEKALKEALAKLDVPEDKIFIDFISLLPVYEWTVEEIGGVRHSVEKTAGYLLQNNAHVEVESEAKARAVVAAAFELGLTDIIAFDYWSNSIGDHKLEAQERAIAAAKRKAELLLHSHFGEMPKPINIAERTTVVYPKSLYESFSADYSQTLQRNYHERNLPQIRKFRPKNTHYRGFFAAADLKDPRLPMRPEISVVSTVTCYYETPGDHEKNDKAETRE